MQAIAEGDGETASRRMRALMLNAAAALRRYIDDRLRPVNWPEPDNL
jgi:hypothetical protein